MVPYSGLRLSMCDIKATNSAMHHCNQLFPSYAIACSFSSEMPVLMKASASKCQIAAVGCQHIILLLCLIIQHKIICNLFENCVKLELLHYIISKFCHNLHMESDGIHK